MSMALREGVRNYALSIVWPMTVRKEGTELCPVYINVYGTKGRCAGLQKLCLVYIYLAYPALIIYRFPLAVLEFGSRLET